MSSISRSKVDTPINACPSSMVLPFQYACCDYTRSYHMAATLSQSPMDPCTSPKASSSRDIQSNINFSSNNKQHQYCRTHIHSPPYCSLVTTFHTHQHVPVQKQPALHYYGEDIKSFTDSFRHDGQKYGGYVLESVQKWEEQQSLFRQLENPMWLTIRDLSSQPQI